ncbi:MAG: ATP-binding protein [Bacillota bacterium]|nr:ATP-binding protein [Bacillota bacterium]
MVDKLFPLGHPVPEEDLVGRLHFVDTLVSRLEEGDSIMLAGPRRIGKTSLAQEALRRLKDKWCYTAAVDCFALRDRKHLAEKIVEGCLANRTGLPRTLASIREKVRSFAPVPVSIKVQDLDLEISLFLNQKASPDELLDQALEFPQKLAEKDDRRVVVLFDEFQEASVVAGEDIFKRMRAAFQKQNRVSYLFLGSKEGIMRSLFSSRRQAFYRFAVPLPVPSVPAEAWLAYIVEKYAGRGIEADRNIVGELLELTGGHPYDTMLLCNEAYHLLLQTGGRELTLTLLRQAHAQALRILEPAFTEILDELGKSAHMREVICRLAADSRPYRGGTHPSSVARTLDRLVEKGVIEKVIRGQYRFVEPMFKDYVTELFACERKH